MKLAKRLGTAAMAAAMAGTLLVGCGSSGTSSGTAAATTDTGASSGSEEAGGDNTYTMFMRSTYVDWIKELKWYDVAEENTGIHVEYISGPEEASDVYSEVDQRVISGDLPDAVMTKLSQTNVYGPEGVFVDLAPYIEKYAPNLQKYIDDNADYKALVTDADGHIYGLSKETPIFADLIGYRVDHFKAAGVDPESIVTVDDFTKALEALKAYYGKDNPNYYPLSGRDTAIRFASWFGAASSISKDESNGVYVGHYKDGSIDIMNDGAYKMVETMKKWYDEGLIQPEWVAGTFSEADWEAAMLNGNASIFYDYYNRAEWFMENGGPDNDPNYQMGVLNFIKDENGNPQKMTVSMKYNDECVTAVNAKCSEDKIKTILTFIDYFYSDEGITLANYGVEGESFKTESNGDKEFIADYQTEEATPSGEKKWSFLSDRFTVCKPVDNKAFFKWNAPLISEACGRLFTDENLGTSYSLKFTDAQSKELTNLIASEYDAQMSAIAQFIDGTRDLTPENWAAFQDEMNTLGLSRIEEIQLEAFKAMY